MPTSPLETIASHTSAAAQITTLPKHRFDTATGTRRAAGNLICLVLLSFVSISGHSAGVTTEPTEIDKILSDVIQAYGGRETLSRVNAVKHSGTIESRRLKKTGAITRLFMWPDHLRVTIDYPGGPSEERISNATEAWRDGQPATKPMHEAMALQAARFALPLLLERHPLTVQNEDADLITLSIQLTDSTALDAIVDKKTWRIVQSLGRMTMGGMMMTFKADYSDFRSVDGVLFPHRESLEAMGMPTGVVALETITINPLTTDEDFRIK